MKFSSCKYFGVLTTFSTCFQHIRQTSVQTGFGTDQLLNGEFLIFYCILVRTEASGQMDNKHCGVREISFAVLLYTIN